MVNNCLIGVDCGTGACKTIIIDYNGRILGQAVKEYPTYYPAPSWAEQDPRDWYNAFCTTLLLAMEQANISSETVKAISFSGATHTAVLLDEKGKILRNAILWIDKRAKLEVDMIKKHFGNRLMSIAYNQINCMWTIAHLLWLRKNETKIWSKIAHILSCKDYIRYRLSNQYVTDYIDASGTMLMDVDKFEWSQELCEFIKLNPSLLPPIVSPFEVVGYITEQGARESGLLKGTPIVTGSSDTVVEMLGAGAILPGEFTVKLATAGRICVTSEKPFIDSRIVVYRHLIKDKWYPGTGTNSCASSYRWFRDTFCYGENQLSKGFGLNTYKIMDLEATKSPPGSNGLLFHPYLLGESSPYYDPELRGDFIGITLRHNKNDFIRAVLEGVAFSLKDSINLLKDLKIVMNKGRLIGGGAQSRIWSQIITDVLNIKLERVECSDAAFGVAMLAGVGINVFDSLEDAVNHCVRVLDFITPNKKNILMYGKLFKIYKESALVLKETNYKLSAHETYKYS